MTLLMPNRFGHKGGSADPWRQQLRVIKQVWICQHATAAGNLSPSATVSLCMEDSRAWFQAVQAVSVYALNG